MSYCYSCVARGVLLLYIWDKGGGSYCNLCVTRGYLTAIHAWQRVLLLSMNGRGSYCYPCMAGGSCCYPCMAEGSYCYLCVTRGFLNAIHLWQGGFLTAFHTWQGVLLLFMHCKGGGGHGSWK